MTQDIVKVGKDPKSHLRVDDELASRMHAVIEVASPDDITLIDLGNEPGTMVNGARINKCKIHPGDTIQIGSTRIVLERADIAASAPPPMPHGTQLGMGAPAPPQFAAAASFRRTASARCRSAFAAAPAAANPFAAAGGAMAFANPNPFAQDGYAVADDARPRHVHVHAHQERTRREPRRGRARARDRGRSDDSLGHDRAARRST